MREAYLYKKLKNSLVQCLTCHHQCIIQPDKYGLCGVRQNQNGKLVALNDDKVIAIQVDPIEKKPFYHFLPDSLTYSIATVGCNFHCWHCQNADISQYPQLHPQNELPGQKISPEQIVAQAQQAGCPSIAYTYTEPTIFLELTLATMKIARQKKLKNIWVSNGYMSQQSLNLILPYLDAINIDLKAMTEKFYQRVCGAKLQPVLDNLIKIKNSQTHVEVTTLIIPTQNDSPTELKQIANFIKNKLGVDTPWHVTAFYPTFKMLNVPATPKEKIKQAVEIGRQAGLKFVYAGNI